MVGCLSKYGTFECVIVPCVRENLFFVHQSLGSHALENE